MTLIDYKFQEEREEEDLPVLQAAWTHRYNHSKTAYKSAEEDWLQPLTTLGPAE